MNRPVLIAVHPGGQVVWGVNAPTGTLVIARAERYREARRAVTVGSRHAYDRKRYLCPGVPEADNDKQAWAAVTAWRDWLCKSFPGLSRIDPPYVVDPAAGGAQ